jgi:hypothetical protein
VDPTAGRLPAPSGDSSQHHGTDPTKAPDRPRRSEVRASRRRPGCLQRRIRRLGLHRPRHATPRLARVLPIPADNLPHRSAHEPAGKHATQVVIGRLTSPFTPPEYTLKQEEEVGGCSRSRVAGEGGWCRCCGSSATAGPLLARGPAGRSGGVGLARLLERTATQRSGLTWTRASTSQEFPPVWDTGVRSASASGWTGCWLARGTG